MESRGDTDVQIVRCAWRKGRKTNRTISQLVPSAVSLRITGVEGSVTLLKQSIQLGCVSRDYPPRKSTLREVGKMGLNHTVNFSKGTWHRVILEPYERNPCAPKFEERTQDETLHQERCARRVAWDLAKNVYKLKNTDKATFYSPAEARTTPAPLQNKSTGKRLRGRLRSIHAHAEQKELS